MENNLSFLKYFIQEDLYLINESREQSLINSGKNEEEVKLEKEVIEKEVLKEEELAEASGIFILVNYPGENKLPGPSMDLFRKILQAVKLTPEDVTIINLHDQDYEKNSFDTGHIKNSKVIAFLDEIPFSYRSVLPDVMYKIIKYGSSEFLWSCSLETLEGKVPEKKKLWENLQKLFNQSQA